MEDSVFIVVVILRILLIWGAYALAESRNRSPWPWAIAALFFGLLSLIVQLFVPTRKEVAA